MNDAEAFLEKRPADTKKFRTLAARGKAYDYEYLWGAPAKSCPRCETKYLPEDFQFCGKCGAKL
ncbi:MAG: zinc-ribbon domain-containing protein [bacterium]